MAVYDGFFDATLNEETGEYDRAYTSSGFTTYFAQIIGTGVCVHNNPDSFKAEFENDGRLFLRMGYLFIQGYWLANVPKEDEDPVTYKGYEVVLPGAGTYAIVAHLNLGAKMIEIEARSVAQAYPDSLVLAIVSPTSAEDTRYNTDLCGIIDTAGELSTKAEWAVNYIDNEIEGKLAAVEQDIAAQERKLDAKIAEVQAVADSIVPPPIGSIKFSASQDVGEEWLRCDGSFVNERDYPELVAALGKLIPSGDKFQLLSDGEIGPQISNGVIYGGRMWVYSYATQKLYGVDLEGSTAVKEIVIASEDAHFASVHPPTAQQPIALSLVKSPVDGKTRIFLMQILVSNALWRNGDASESFIWSYTAEFLESVNLLQVSRAFTEVSIDPTSYIQLKCRSCIPYVTSVASGGTEWFYCMVGTSDEGMGYAIKWGLTDALPTGESSWGAVSTISYVRYVDGQRVAYNKKNKEEAVFVASHIGYTTSSYYVQPDTSVRSSPKNIFQRGSSAQTPIVGILSEPIALGIVGQDKMIFELSEEKLMYISLTDADAPKVADISLPLPGAARIFVDGGAYLWGKDIFMIFVGTGIIFSRTLEEGSFGYLDTTSVLGTITQFGYLDYDRDEGTLYLLGQDTANKVKVAKIVLNTLYDYANDGAWLPMIAADGVPAYIKAKESDIEIVTDPVDLTITVLQPSGRFDEYADVIFNGVPLLAGTYTRTLSKSGTFTVGMRGKEWSGGFVCAVKMNGNNVVSGNIPATNPNEYEKTASFIVSDFISTGITLQGTT